MATIQNVTELRCWQEARLITEDVYLLAQSGLFGKDYGLRDQVQRAVVSIESNIAEGFERGSNAELVKFLSYAKGPQEKSCRNCIRHLMWDIFHKKTWMVWWLD